MKTSNKILLGAFVTALLILSGLHIAIYAKYKSGHYTVINKEMLEPDMTTYPMDGIRFVSVQNMSVVLYPSGQPRLRFEEEKKKQNNFTIEKRNDTLYLSWDNKNKTRWIPHARIYLSGNIPVKASGSEVGFGGGQWASTNASSVEILLDSSELWTSSENNKTLYLSTLKVTARNQSTVEMNNVSLNIMDIKLEHSTMEERNAYATKFILQADPSSRVDLSAENLLKMKLKNIVDSSGVQ